MPRLLIFSWTLLSAINAQTPVPTYTGGVSQILEKHCTACHRDGLLGRIPLDSYPQARLFAPEIRLAIGTRKMPPWLAVAGFGDFRNDPSLSVAEMETLIQWADANAPPGTLPKQPPSQAKPLDWAFGPPDLILQPKAAVRVPAVGEVECQCFTIKTRLRDSKAVRAIDVLPGDRRLVEYVRVSVGSEGDDCSREIPTSSARASLGEWSAALAPDELPQGIGRLLPSRSNVIVEIRYRKIGYALSDRSRIGLYFHKNPIKQYVQTQTITSGALRVPSGEWSFHEQATWRTAKNVTLLSVSPHMGNLGTEMCVAAELPGGNTKNLVWVREYDRNRQMAYLFRHPINLPAGSTVHVSGYFDNSASNRKIRSGNSGTSPKEDILTAFLEYVEDSH